MAHPVYSYVHEFAHIKSFFFFVVSFQCGRNTQPAPLGPDDYLRLLDYQNKFGNNPQRINELMTRAKAAFPDNIKIHCANLRSSLVTPTTEAESKVNFERVRSTYSDGLTKYPNDVDFFYEFLVAIDQHAFTIPMQDQIVGHVRRTFIRSKDRPYYFYKMALREYHYPYVRCQCGLNVKVEPSKGDVKTNDGVLSKNKENQCQVCKEAALKKSFENFGKMLNPKSLRKVRICSFACCCCCSR